MTDNDDLGQHPSKRRCPLPDCGMWSHCDHTVADVFDRIADLEATVAKHHTDLISECYWCGWEGGVP